MALIIKSLTQKDTGKQWDSTGRIDTIDDPTRHNGPSVNTGAVSGGSTPSASAYVAPVKRPGFVKGIGENAAAGGYEALEDLNPERVYHGTQAATNYASATTYRDLANGSIEEDGEAALIGSKFMTTPERQAAFARKAEEATARGNEEIEKFKAVENWFLPDSEKQKWVQEAKVAREDPNASGVSRFLNSLAYSGGRMLPTMAAGLVTGGAASAAGGAAELASSVAASATIFSNVYTNSLEQNLDAGMANEVAVNKALGDALVEASTEIVVGGMPGMGKGLISAEKMGELASSLAENSAARAIVATNSTRLIERYGAKAVQTLAAGAEFITTNPIGAFVFDAFGEGAEEVASEFLSPVVNRAVLGADYSSNVNLAEQLRNPAIAEMLSTETPTTAEWGEAFLSGFLLSAFSNGFVEAGKRITGNVDKPKAPYLQPESDGNVSYVDPATGTKKTINVADPLNVTPVQAQTQAQIAQARPARIQAQTPQVQPTQPAAPAQPQTQTAPAQTTAPTPQIQPQTQTTPTRQAAPAQAQAQAQTQQAQAAPVADPSPEYKYASTIQGEVMILNKGIVDGVRKTVFEAMGAGKGYNINKTTMRFLPEPLVYHNHMTQEEVDAYVKNVVNPTLANVQAYFSDVKKAETYDKIAGNYPMRAKVDASWIDTTKVDPTKVQETLDNLTALQSKKGLKQSEWNKAVSAVGVPAKELFRGYAKAGTLDTAYGKGTQDIFRAHRDIASSNANNYKGEERRVARFVTKSGAVMPLTFNAYVRMVQKNSKELKGLTWSQMSEEQRNKLEDGFAKIIAQSDTGRDQALEQLNAMLPEGVVARMAKPGELDARKTNSDGTDGVDYAQKATEKTADGKTITVLKFNPRFITSRAAVALSAAHEIVHVAAERARADGGKSLLNLHEDVADLAKAMGYDYTELYNIVKKYYPKDPPDVIEEEVDARFISYMLVSNGFLADLADSGKAGKDAIKGIRAILEGHLVDAPDTEVTRKQRQIVADMTDALNGTLRERAAARAANTVNPADVAPSPAPETAPETVEDDDFVPGIDDQPAAQPNATAGVIEPNTAAPAKAAPNATEGVIEPAEAEATDAPTRNGFTPVAGGNTATMPTEVVGTDANALRTPRLITEAYPLKYDQLPNVLKGFKARYDYNHNRIEIVKPSGTTKLSPEQRDALRAIGAEPTHQWKEKDADGNIVLAGVPGLWRVRRDAANTWAQYVDAPDVSNKQLRDTAREVAPSTVKQTSAEEMRRRRRKALEAMYALDDITVAEFPGIEGGTIEIVWGNDTTGKSVMRFVVSKADEFSPYERRWLTALGFRQHTDTAFDGVEQVVFSKIADLSKESDDSFWQAAKAGNKEALELKGVRPSYQEYPFMDSSSLVMEFVRDKNGSAETRVHTKNRWHTEEEKAALNELGFKYDRLLNRYVKSFDANEWVNKFKGPKLTLEQLDAANATAAETNAVGDYYRSLNWLKAKGDGFAGYQYATDQTTGQLLIRKWNKKTKSYDYMAAPLSDELLKRVKNTPNATEGVFEPNTANNGEPTSAENYDEDDDVIPSAAEINAMFAGKGGEDNTATGVDRVRAYGIKARGTGRNKVWASDWGKTIEIPGTSITKVRKSKVKGKEDTYYTKPLSLDMRVNYSTGNIEIKFPKALEITNTTNELGQEEGTQVRTAVLRMLNQLGFRASALDPMTYEATYSDELLKYMGGTPIADNEDLLTLGQEAYKKRQAELANRAKNQPKEARVRGYSVDDLAKENEKLAKAKAKRPAPATVMGLGLKANRAGEYSIIEQSEDEITAAEKARAKELKKNSKLATDGQELSPSQQKFFAKSTGTKTANGKLIPYYAQENATGAGLTPTDGSFGTGFYLGTSQPSTPANVHRVFVLSERPVVMSDIYTDFGESGRRQVVIPATKVPASAVADTVNTVKTVADTLGFDLNADISRIEAMSQRGDLLLGDLVKLLAQSATYRSDAPLGNRVLDVDTLATALANLREQRSGRAESSATPTDADYQKAREFLFAGDNSSVVSAILKQATADAEQLGLVMNDTPAPAGLALEYQKVSQGRLAEVMSSVIASAKRLGFDINIDPTTEAAKSSYKNINFKDLTRRLAEQATHTTTVGEDYSGSILSVESLANVLKTMKANHRADPGRAAFYANVAPTEADYAKARKLLALDNAAAASGIVKQSLINLGFDSVRGAIETKNGRPQPDSIMAFSIDQIRSVDNTIPGKLKRPLAASNESSKSSRSFAGNDMWEEPYGAPIDEIWDEREDNGGDNFEGEKRDEALLEEAYPGLIDRLWHDISLVQYASNLESLEERIDELSQTRAYIEWLITGGYEAEDNLWYPPLENKELAAILKERLKIADRYLRMAEDRLFNEYGYSSFPDPESRNGRRVFKPFDVDEYNAWYADYANRVGTDAIAESARENEVERYYEPEDDFDIDEYNAWYADYVNRVGIDAIAERARENEVERYYEPEEDFDESAAADAAHARSLYTEYIYDVAPRLADMEVFDAMDPNVVNQITNGGDLTDEAALAFLRYYDEVESRLFREEFDEGADEVDPRINAMSPTEYEDFLNGDLDLWDDIFDEAKYNRTDELSEDELAELDAKWEAHKAARARRRDDTRNTSRNFSGEDIADLLELTGFAADTDEQADFYSMPRNESMFDYEDAYEAEEMNELFRQWAYQGQRHGTYEGSTVPKAVADDGTYVSKAAATTYDQLLKDATADMQASQRAEILRGAASYTAITDARALKEAHDWIIANSTNTPNGYVLDVAKAYSQIENTYRENNHSLNKLQEAKLDMLAKAIAENPNTTAEDYALVAKLAAMRANNQHYAASTVQGAKMVYKLGPIARLFSAYTGLENLKDDLNKMAKRKGINQKAYQQAAKNLANWQIPKNLIDDLMAAQTEQQQIAAEDAIRDAIAEQIPPTPAMRLRAWRFLAMLGNFRTPIRNVAGNTVQGMMKIAANQVSGAVQDYRAARGDVFERTNSLSVRPTQAIKNFSRGYYETMKHALDGTGKYSMESDIMRRVNAFGAKSDIGKFFMALPNLANKGTNWMLNNEKFGDAAFLKAHFSAALANYLAANAQQWTGSADPNAVLNYIQSGTQDANDRFNKAVDYAVQEALKATFRDASKLASTLDSLAKNSTIADVMISGVIPFKKTPINIAKRGIHDYSPWGLIEHTSRVLRGQIGTEVGRGSSAHTYTEQEAINGIAEGLTGTAALVLGYLLGGLGIIKPSGDEEDKRKENYMKMLGYQDYSVTVNGVNYTLDWVTPTSIPFMAGAELGLKHAEAAAEGDESMGATLSDTVDTLAEVAAHMADPMTDLSVLSGVSDALNAAKYSEGGAALGSIAASGAQSLAFQYIPTIFGQAARVADPVRRDAYNAENKTDIFFNRVQNKLPGGTDNLEPYVDLWGRTEQNVGAFGDDGLLSRIAGQGFIPWYARQINVTKVDDQLSELFAESGTSTVLPKKPAKTESYSGGDYKYKPGEYTWVAENQGQLSYKGVASAFDSRYFDQLDTAEKADVISNIYTYSGYATKQDFASAHPSEVTYSNKTGVNTVKRVAFGERFGLSVGDYYSIKALLEKNELTTDKKKTEYLTALGLNELQIMPFLTKVPEI